MRYALELAGVEYTDVRVEPGPGMCYMPLLLFFWVKLGVIGAYSIGAYSPPSS